MATHATAISSSELLARLGTPCAPVLFDVRRREAFIGSERLIAGSRWRDHLRADQWGGGLDPAAEVVVTCVHGHGVSQLAAAKLRALGLRARYLEGGAMGFFEAGGLSILHRDWLHDLGQEPSRWVTCEKPKVDGLACPWFIRRFLDCTAEIFYVEPEWVTDIAAEIGGVVFDVDGVGFSHKGTGCSFDAFLDHFGVEDESLRQMARIIRGADTADLDLEPQCAGLLALLLGLSRLYDDLVAQEHAMLLFDSLYSWLRGARSGKHRWSAKNATA